MISEANGWSQGACMLQSAGYAVQGKGWMPFQAFDMTDANNPRQINVSFRLNNATPTKLQWDMSWDGTTFADQDGYAGRNYTFIHNTDYNPDYYLDPTLDPTYNDVVYAWWPYYRGSHPYLEDKFSLIITPNFPSTYNDTFTFIAPAAKTSSLADAKADVEKINVFPNPYYGFNSRETTRAGKYVTFSHLPAKAKIRIFDLAGTQVRVINKNDPSQFINWDLQNQNNYPVASGVYIAYIDMPGIGATKIVKIAVVQEQQILNVY